MHPDLASAHTVTASVSLDIGEGRGALVIYPDDRYRGSEIEISPTGSSSRVHTGVHERRSRSGSVLAAIFGSLPVGEYLVWADPPSRSERVTVSDGAITELALP